MQVAPSSKTHLQRQKTVVKRTSGELPPKQNTNYKQLQSLYQELQDGYNDRATSNLRKYMHRDLFASQSPQHKVPPEVSFEEAYLVNRDLYSGVCQDFLPAHQKAKKSAQINEETMRAFNIALSRESPETQSSPSDAESEDSNCFTPPNDSDTSWTPPSSAASTDGFDQSPPQKAQLQRKLNVPKRRSRPDLKVDTERTLTKRQSESTLGSTHIKRQPTKKRTKSVDFGKRISSLFKSPTPDVPDLPLGIENMRINDELPQLDVPVLKPEQHSTESYYPSSPSPSSSPVSPTKFDFLHDSARPKPSRLHITDFPSTHEEDSAAVQEKSLMSHRDPDVAMVYAGIPPRVPPHRTLSNSSSNPLNNPHNGDARESVSLIASPGRSMSMSAKRLNSTNTDEPQSPLESPRPTTTHTTGRRYASNSSIASSVAIGPMRSEIYTRKCSFQRHQRRPSVQEEQQQQQQAQVVEPESPKKKKKNVEFMLPGYNETNRLKVINKSTERLNMESDDVQVREFKPKQQPRQVQSCYGPASSGLLEDTAWSTSNQTPNPEPRYGECNTQYFGLDLLTDRPQSMSRCGDLWQDRGQRFLSWTRR